MNNTDWFLILLIVLFNGVTLTLLLRENLKLWDEILKIRRNLLEAYKMIANLAKSSNGEKQ